MNEPKYVDISRRMTSSLLKRRLESLERSVDRQLADLGARNLGRSGVAFAVIGRLYEAEVPSVVQLTWENLWRAALHVGLEPSPDLAERLKAEIREQTGSYFDALRTRLGQHDNQIGCHSPEPYDVFMKARNLALAEMDAEIDLAVASLEHKAEAEGARFVQQFYGPVGVAQSGFHISASVVQNIGAQEKAELAAALTGILTALQHSVELQGQRKTEVIELVQEACDEVGKPGPNRLRLASVLQGIAGVVQTIGSADAAYRTLKATAALIGIQLP